MAGTQEGGKKAAETRKENEPEAFQKMGHEGGTARQDKSEEERSEIAKKAAETRKEHDPDAFKKMGETGGSHSHGGTTKKESEE